MPPPTTTVDLDRAGTLLDEAGWKLTDAGAIRQQAGVTLTALRARGVDREQALRTSLLMSIPVTVGAAGLTAVRGRARPPLVPTALAAGTAYATARRVPSARTVVAASVAYRLVLAAAVAVRRAKERA